MQEVGRALRPPGCVYCVSGLQTVQKAVEISKIFLCSCKTRLCLLALAATDVWE